jgi:hypothetical protein
MTPAQTPLIPSEEPQPVPMADGFFLAIERLASNPQVDPEKLERFMAMYERVLAFNARAAFNASFAAMQAELPVIAERGKTDKARYATLDDIVEVVRPILARHLFSLSHKSEWLDGGRVKIVGILAHEQGHEKCSEFQTPPDISGSKNSIQALGSALSYGRRYTTLDLLNIVSRYQDDDGQTADAKAAAEPDEPVGFVQWASDMEAVADTGLAAFNAAWKASKREFTEYALKHRQSLSQGMKARAMRKAVPRG